MESILLFLPIFFSFFTGMLIAWSLYLMIIMTCKSKANIGYSKNLIKTICLCVMFAFSVFLTSILFIFTAFAAFHMATILFLEIWYITFLYRITISPWNTPCHQLVEMFTIRKKSKIIQ